MNYLLKTFAGLLGLILITGCPAGSELIQNDDTEDRVSGTFVLPTALDYEVPEASDYNVDFTLNNDVIDTRLMMLESLPQVVFKVWSFDEMVADVAATNIAVSEFPLRPQSVAYTLRFSASDLQAVEFSSGATEAMRYYVTFGVDVDRDGKICNGDYRQDYNVTRPERFPLSVSSVTRDIKITAVSGEICDE